MLNISFAKKTAQENFPVELEEFKLNLRNKSLEEQVKLLILRDLLKVNWNVNFEGKKVVIEPPRYYDKETIKQAMSVKRDEIISKNKVWIEKHIQIARELIPSYPCFPQSRLPEEVEYQNCCESSER